MDILRQVAALLFALAVVHTFFVKFFLARAARLPHRSFAYHVYHALGEVELVFAVWCMPLIATGVFLLGWNEMSTYLSQLDFTEPCFIFVVMAIAASRPILWLAARVVETFAKVLPLREDRAYYFSALTVGPILGSFITEPAAMTVTALLLKNRYFENGLSVRMKYITIAVLFVNVSIGGVFTSFAAPPVLMVASTWGWTSMYMATHFGPPALLAVLVNAGVALALLPKEKILPKTERRKGETKPLLVLFHLIFLATVIAQNHYPKIFIGLFVAFLGLVHLTPEYQDKLKIKESSLVAVFLGGLVVMGSFQGFWVAPLVQSLSDLALFWGATGLTAILDNAALTFLGAQIPDLSETMKYFLVAGAVAGGGLTVIANAPNPAGYSILNSSFGEKGISPIQLLVYALLPTLVACLSFLLV